MFLYSNSRRGSRKVVLSLQTLPRVLILKAIGAVEWNGDGLRDYPNTRAPYILQARHS